MFTAKVISNCGKILGDAVTDITEVFVAFPGGSHIQEADVGEDSGAVPCEVAGSDVTRLTDATLPDTGNCEVSQVKLSAPSDDLVLVGQRQVPHEDTGARQRLSTETAPRLTAGPDKTEAK